MKRPTHVMVALVDPNDAKNIKSQPMLLKEFAKLFRWEKEYSTPGNGETLRNVLRLVEEDEEKD